MPTDITKEIADKILPYGSLGILGGIALQLNILRKGGKLKLWLTIANILLSGYIGYVCGSLLPDSIGDLKFSLISVSGFLSYPILDFIENKGFNLLIKKYIGQK